MASTSNESNDWPSYYARKIATLRKLDWIYLSEVNPNVTDMSVLGS